MYLVLEIIQMPELAFDGLCFLKQIFQVSSSGAKRTELHVLFFFSKKFHLKNSYQLC